MTDRSAKIDLNDIPGAGFNVPTYCGGCGKKPEGSKCLKHSRTPSDYLEKNNEFPRIYYIAIPFLIIMMPVGTLAISQTIGYDIIVPSVGLSAGLIPFFGYLAYVLWRKGKRIQAMGTVQCPSCQREVGSKSKFCVYCGKPVAWLY